MYKTPTAYKYMICERRHLPLLLTVVMTSVVFSLRAQLPDGTKATREWIDVITSNRNEEESLTYNSASAYYTADLSVVAYIVRNEEGLARCDEDDLATAVSFLNQYFSPINLSFRLASVAYVNDYHYGMLWDDSSAVELVKKHSREGAINLYLVDSIWIDSVRCYGFTFFPDDTTRNTIFLDQAMVSGNYLVTLMGHFFGLLSTHESLGGAERADQNNCAESGDFLCDTWADPNLFGWVDTACAYTGNHADIMGIPYVPSVANLMSESLDGCKCIFTAHQYRRMLYYLKNYRDYLR